MRNTLNILVWLLLTTNIAHAQIITTICGNGVWGDNGDGGPATGAQFNQPYALAIDDSGNMFVMDVGNDNLRKVSASGMVSHVSGWAGLDSGEDPATTLMTYGKPHCIALDKKGNIYTSDLAFSGIRRISNDGTVEMVGGISRKSGYSGDWLPALDSRIGRPEGIAFNAVGEIIFCDEANNMVRKITTDGTMCTIAGTGKRGYSGDSSRATEANLDGPWGIAVDNAGNVYFADTHNHVVRKINNVGVITTVGGNHTKGYSGDGGPATAAQLNDPRGICVDNNGNLFIADHNNQVVRKVDKDGIITTYAGTGSRGYKGDGGPAVSAQLNEPYAVAMDNLGNLFIADDQNHVVRKVSAIARLPVVITADTADNVMVTADPDANELIITVTEGHYNLAAISTLNRADLLTQTIVAARTRIDVSSLKPGRYLLTLTGAKRMKTVIFQKDTN